jgi:hypothetical protein
MAKLCYSRTCYKLLALRGPRKKYVILNGVKDLDSSLRSEQL